MLPDGEDRMKTAADIADQLAEAHGQVLDGLLGGDPEAA